MATPPKYPLSTGVKRPIRLWDAKGDKPIPWRNFKHADNAYDRALADACRHRTSIVVYDARSGDRLWQFTRRGKVIDIYEPRESK